MLPLVHEINVLGFQFQTENKYESQTMSGRRRELQLFDATGRIHLGDLRPYLGACCFILSCYVRFYFEIVLLNNSTSKNFFLFRKNFPIVLVASVNSRCFALVANLHFVNPVSIPSHVSCAFHSK